MKKKWLKLVTSLIIICSVLYISSENVYASSNENSFLIGNIDLNFFKILPYKMLFFNGLMNTLKLTAVSLIGGTILGIVISLIKVSNIFVLRLLARFYTSIFRGTPLMVQLFIAYFATPQLTGNNISAFFAAVITFSLNSAAYVSEILRGGIESVDSGQTEASLALGVSELHTMMEIIIPQALRSVLPALVNEAIALLKDSSLVSTIGMLDLMRASQTAMNATYLAFEPFITVAIIYYILVVFLAFLANTLERRMKVND